jgi:putative SOS response-associated peptidase YedK
VRSIVGRSDKQRIAEHFRTHGDLSELLMPPEDYNVAPSTTQPIIRHSRETGEREMVLMRWRLVPFFTKDAKELKGLSTISARGDDCHGEYLARAGEEAPLPGSGECVL